MNMISPIHPQDGSGTGTDPTSGSSTGLPSATGLNNMFLQLLVAQLQNQSPLDPSIPRSLWDSWRNSVNSAK